MSERRTTDKSNQQTTDRDDRWLSVGNAKRRLDSLSGDPIHSELDADSSLQYDWLTDRLSSGFLDAHILDLAKYDKLEEALRQKGKTIEDVPLEDRKSLRDKVWEAFCEQEDERIVATVLEEKKLRYQAKITRNARRATARGIGYTFGPGVVISSVNTPSQTVKQTFANSKSDLQPLYTFSEKRLLQPYIAGERRSGKSMLMAGLASMAIGDYSGYIRPYFPEGMRHRYQATQYYSHEWEIYIDEPKGTSILWTVVDAQRLEEEWGVELPIFALLMKGEQGLGDETIYGSTVAKNARTTYALAGHFRTHYLMSGVIGMSVADEWKFVDPLIVCHAMDIKGYDDTGNRNRDYWIEVIYKEWTEKRTPGKKKIIHGIEPFDFYKQAKKGLALDMASDVQYFQVEKMIAEADLYNNEGFAKDPDHYISEASEYVKELARDTGFQWKSKKEPPKMDSFMNRQGDPEDEANEKQEREESEAPLEKMPWES